jgi:hypothetical protein
MYPAPSTSTIATPMASHPRQGIEGRRRLGAGREVAARCPLRARQVAARRRRRARHEVAVRGRLGARRAAPGLRASRRLADPVLADRSFAGERGVGLESDPDAPRTAARRLAAGVAVPDLRIRERF